MTCLPNIRCSEDQSQCHSGIIIPENTDSEMPSVGIEGTVSDFRGTSEESVEDVLQIEARNYLETIQVYSGR